MGGGEWISSVALENEICSMSGVNHPKYQERPVVIIQMKNDQNKKPTLDEVKEFLMKTDKFSKFQLPDDVIFDKIPLTGTGKMSKKLCREKMEKEKYILPSLRKKDN